jgi:hypothetical protein
MVAGVQPSVEDADLLSSAPRSIAKRIHIDLTKETIRRDAELLGGLQAAGFALDDGPDHAGLLMKFMQRGGGYYIDVGASQLIVDGAIKIVQGQEVRRIGPHAVVLANGTELPADEVVLATGFQNMRSTTRKILGDAVADRVPDVWGFDEEGESRTMWRRTGHPGFWFMGGNLALARFYSRLLALQIKALEEGIVGYEDK